MKKMLFWAVLLIILALPVLPEKKKDAALKLPEKHRRWLQEEVVYIITPIEKNIFVILQTDRERDAFISAFWKQRDPNPNTPENEFQTEHYRRIQYANNWFGKESPAPGWRTDMGRIYITLGEPKTIERFENETEVHPTIIWFYQNMGQYKLPDAFSVVFFKKDGVGEYELYSPVKYGPQHLIINYEGDMTDYVAAYQKMLNIQPVIAGVSLSLVPGEPLTGNASIASEILIHDKIPSAPQNKINNLYAEKFLKYKEIVDVDYTANYIDSRALVTFTCDRTNVSFVHYLIEPSKLSVEESQGKFYTQLEIYGNVTDRSGNIVHQIKDNIPISMDLEQMKKIRDKSFSFQSIFPLVPGKYKIIILLKNTVFKEYTSLEKEIEIPDHSGLKLSPLLLANRMAENPEFRLQTKPFTFGTSQLLPSARNDFLSSDTLYLFFQVYGLSAELRENALLEFSIDKDNQKVHSFFKQVKEYPQAPDFLEQIPLAKLPPANYTIKVTLRSGEKVPLASSENYFYITPMTSLTRPWVVSRPLPAAGHPQFQNELGNQYLSLKQTAKARVLLEKAYLANPRHVKFAQDYCQLLLQVKEYAKAKEIASPFIMEQKYELAYCLGQACQALGEYEAAIGHYRIYLSHFGTIYHVFNSLGDCHLALGKKEEAILAWDKSLEINPAQPELRARVDKLKKGEK